MKILVLGDDTRAFLSVVRSLGRGGAEVHVAWHDPAGPAARSRYIRKAHALPSIEGAWLEAFQALMRAERFDLVIPCTDPIVASLQAKRAELEPLGKLYLLSDEAFEVTSCKFKTAELARSLGIPVARELIVDSKEAIHGAFELPVVLKPRTSYQPGLPGKRKVRKAYSWQELERALAEMLPHGAVSVQENFIGRGVGVEVLMHEGKLLLAFQHIRLHEPMHGGGSSYRQGQALDPALLDASVRLLGGLRYTGVAMVEFKVDPESGRWILIEVNGRFWGSLPLAIESGVDFPHALAELLVRGRTEFPRRYLVGLCCRNWRSDLIWLRKNWRADRTDPTLAALPLAHVITETLWNLVTLKERSDTFTLDDPMPGLAELADMVKDAAAPLSVRIPFVRRRMRARALAALAGARRIVFVCKGNICRSPFAEHLAAAWWGAGREYVSAALLPLGERPAPPEAAEAARKRGVDLSAHRSRTLDAGLVESADLIFVFDAQNHDAVIERFPQAAQKVHFLGALAQNGPLWITDPFGKGVGAFERAYELIWAAITPPRRASAAAVRAAAAANTGGR
jgi:protein-tyrosine-phosphatase/predicted ATP-grasp superfamily ATP-dependent carboligase